MYSALNAEIINTVLFFLTRNEANQQFKSLFTSFPAKGPRCPDQLSEAWNIALEGRCGRSASG